MGMTKQFMMEKYPEDTEKDDESISEVMMESMKVEETVQNMVDDIQAIRDKRRLRKIQDDIIRHTIMLLLAF